MEEIYTYVDVMFEQIEPFAMKCKGSYVSEVLEGFGRRSFDVVSISVSIKPQNRSYIEVSSVGDIVSWFSTVADYDYYLTLLQELKDNGAVKL